MTFKNENNVSIALKNIHSLYKTKSRLSRDFVLFEIELFEKICMTNLVLSLKILEVSAAVGNHFQQSAAGVVVFLVCLKMFCEFVDARRKDSYLNMG